MDMIINWFQSGFSAICDILSDIANGILMLLPNSPFYGFEMPSEFQNILGYINWLIPFGMICNTLLLWVTAIGVYYGYQAFLRLTKAIE